MREIRTLSGSRTHRNVIRTSV